MCLGIGHNLKVHESLKLTTDHLDALSSLFVSSPVTLSHVTAQRYLMTVN